MYFQDSVSKKFESVREVQGHITYYKYVPARISNGTLVNPTAIPNGMKMVSVGARLAQRRMTTSN